MQFLEQLKQWARDLKSKLVVAHLVSVDPATPWYAKLILVLTLAYALSPIDLIPDFIPILGLLDDLIIVPFGIWIAFKMVPVNIIERCTSEAINFQWNKKKNLFMAVFIILLWLSIFAFLIYNFSDRFQVLVHK